MHARNAGLIAGLLGLALFESRRWPDRGLIATFLATAAVLFAVRTGVTYHLWGTWLTTPHERFGEVSGLMPLVTESVTRVTGWLFDQEHGLLPYAPIYLLVPAGWVALWQRDRALCRALSLVIGAYVAVMTIPLLNAHGWRGGWTPAARFLVPVIPFLAILAFGAVAHRRRIPVLVLAIVALQVCLDAIVWQRPGLLWNNGIGTSALLQYPGWRYGSALVIGSLDRGTAGRPDDRPRRRGHRRLGGADRVAHGADTNRCGCVSGFGLRALGFGLRASGLRLRASGLGPSSKSYSPQSPQNPQRGSSPCPPVLLRVLRGGELAWASGFGLQALGFGLWDSGLVSSWFESSDACLNHEGTKDTKKPIAGHFSTHPGRCSPSRSSLTKTASGGRSPQRLQRRPTLRVLRGGELAWASGFRLRASGFGLRASGFGLRAWAWAHASASFAGAR